jgi:hypothetical protein
VSGETVSLNFEIAEKATTGITTITTKNGVIKIVATAEQYGNLAKMFGAIGRVSTGFEMIENVQKYQNGEISGSRFTYRLTGETVSLLSDVLADAAIGSEAGPWGTVAGIVIGVATPAGEVLYDKAIVPATNRTSDWVHKYFIDPIAHIEASLKNGWLP